MVLFININHFHSRMCQYLNRIEIIHYIRINQSMETQNNYYLCFLSSSIIIIIIFERIENWNLTHKTITYNSTTIFACKFIGNTITRNVERETKRSFELTETKMHCNLLVNGGTFHPNILLVYEWRKIKQKKKQNKDDLIS